MAETQYYGTGKRKTSIARVFLRTGKGEITVNGRKLDDYISTVTQRVSVREPLAATDASGLSLNWPRGSRARSFHISSRTRRTPTSIGARRPRRSGATPMARSTFWWPGWAPAARSPAWPAP